jgi:hypothetical protein
VTNPSARSLHGLAELLLAGPQYRRSGTIRLRVTPAGFATVAAPDVQAEADALVVDGRRIPYAGQTFAQLAAAAGLELGVSEAVYKEHSGVRPDDPIVTTGAAAVLDALAVGDAALRLFAPDATPVLWPEHFDVGISLDEVNYGVSTGDSAVPEPYAYVGPWKPREGDFWNVSFGAARPLSTLGDATAVAAFFAEGRAAA